MEKNLPEFEHARVRAAIDEAVCTRSRRSNSSTRWSAPTAPSDGRTRRAVPILDDAGHIIEWFGTASDVTRRKQAEEELQDIRSRMEAALEAGAIGTWAWDVQADRFHGDPSLARIFCVPPEAVAGGPLAGIVRPIHPDDRERVTGLVNRAVESGDRYEADYRVDRGPTGRGGG